MFQVSFHSPCGIVMLHCCKRNQLRLWTMASLGVRTLKPTNQPIQHLKWMIITARTKPKW